MDVTAFVFYRFLKTVTFSRTSDVQSLHNETQAALQEAKDTLLSTFGDKIDGVTRSVDQSNVTFQESILALR